MGHRQTFKRFAIFSDDLAEAIYFITQNFPGSQMMNIGSGEEISIRNLSKILYIYIYI